MNRSSPYALDMLQEEDDDDFDNLNSLKDFGATTGFGEFNSLDKLESGYSSARNRESNSE